MTRPWASVTSLTPEIECGRFESGLESVDTWFQTKAHAEHRAGRVRTHVCLDDAGSVAGFYALKFITVNLRGESKRMQGIGDVDGSSPGLLLAQMGVRRDLQTNSGAGKRLLGHAFSTAVELHERASFRLLVTDAATERLVGWYTKRGFTPLAHDRRLVIKMSAVLRIASNLSV